MVSIIELKYIIPCNIILLYGVILL